MQTLDRAGSNHSAFSMIRASVTGSGICSLYTGLTASLLRQMTYSLVRLGSYEEIKRRLSEKSTANLILAASVAGGLGGIAGNPAGELVSCPGTHVLNQFTQDILLIRMTSDSVRPPDKQYRYTNVLSGLVSLLKAEGIPGLTRGLGTNTVGTCIQLPWTVLIVRYGRLELC